MPLELKDDVSRPLQDPEEPTGEEEPTGDTQDAEAAREAVRRERLEATQEATKAALERHRYDSMGD